MYTTLTVRLDSASRLLLQLHFQQAIGTNVTAAAQCYVLQQETKRNRRNGTFLSASYHRIPNRSPAPDGTGHETVESETQSSM